MSFLPSLLRCCSRSVWWLKYLQPVEQRGIYMAAGGIDGFGECRLTVTGSSETLQVPLSQWWKGDWVTQTPPVCFKLYKSWAASHSTRRTCREPGGRRCCLLSPCNHAIRTEEENRVCRRASLPPPFLVLRGALQLENGFFILLERRRKVIAHVLLI